MVSFHASNAPSTGWWDCSQLTKCLIVGMSPSRSITTHSANVSHHTELRARFQLVDEEPLYSVSVSSLRFGFPNPNAVLLPQYFLFSPTVQGIFLARALLLLLVDVFFLFVKFSRHPHIESKHQHNCANHVACWQRGLTSVGLPTRYYMLFVIFLSL